MVRVRSLLGFIVFPLVSGALLVLAFPMYDLGMLAWIGLVPLLVTLWGKGVGQGALCGFLCSLVFFPGIFSWILEIPGYTWVHHALLALYLGSYFALFGAALAFVSNQSRPFTTVFLAPALWVSLEYVRSNLSFLALPWGLLAHSQYLNTRIIQCASITGAYGVSFLVVLLNSALALLILTLLSRAERYKPRIFWPLPWRVISAAVLPAAALFALASLYGAILISKPVTGHEIKIAVIQGSIEQSKKWNPSYGNSIMQTYADLSRGESRERPALIAWPETATPDSITRDPNLLAQVKSIARETGAYLLLGSSQHQKLKKSGTGQINYLNSAFVVSPDGEIPLLQQYDKIHLLPFGEYLPLKGAIPWSLIGIYEFSSYTPGEKITLLEIPPFRFGATICWENIFPDLVRQFVKHGAQFIVNITNEAWFGKTAAPFQFLSMSVFRAVENQVYVVRCANTGISCFIDPYGRISRRVTDGSGKDIFVRGSLTSTVIPLESKTIYTRYGDWFPLLCCLYCAYVLLCSVIPGNAARRTYFGAR